MQIKFKRFLSLFMAIIILCYFSACKDTEKQHNDTSKPTANNDISVSESDDAIDPENTENIVNDGVKVIISEITAQEGKQNGIDVSKWQGKIDWKQVKNDGIDFAIIRIGYRGENGKLYRDDNAEYNIQQAIKSDILVGVYFFSTAVNTAEATEEAQWVLSAIKGYAISYPVVYDCEGFKNADSRMYSLTADERTQNTLTFLDTVKNAGYDGMFYGSKSDLEDNSAFNTNKIAEKYKIWVAQYTNPPYPQKSSPDYMGKYDMWQYTNKGVVSGVEGNCDMVVSYFAETTKKPKDESVVNEKAEPPKTQEELLYTDVNETVTAKNEVNMRSGAGTNFDVVAVLKNGVTLTRTGIGKNGWSKLMFNGHTVYAITSYLTTDLSTKPETSPDIVDGNTFTAKNDKVTAKQEVNLRISPTTSAEVIGTLQNGTVLERTATSNKGWSRLIYNGQTVYAVTSYLTEDLTYKPPVDDGIKTEFSEVNEQVTAKNETNLRTLPSVTDSQVVYTLKNGEYLTRTGISTNGWSRLIYNGQTVYAVSSYLTQ